MDIKTHYYEELIRMREKKGRVNHLLHLLLSLLTGGLWVLVWIAVAIDAHNAVKKVDRAIEETLGGANHDH